jgi:formate--tetrahydrofolate ligase
MSPSDAEIQRSACRRPIEAVAADLGLTPADLHPYGRDVAKVDVGVLRRPRARPGQGRLILVSAITPTAAGEGKTTTSIGLAQGLARLGESSCVALREPSLGPNFGAKGGGTGGGRSQLVPGDRIDLHFTGDFHAVTSAHNLLAALIDNHLHHGNALEIDPRRVTWRRVMDVNDRALRNIVVGLGGPGDGVPRETGFDITAASEVMAILCLAEDAEDLRARLARTLIAFTQRRLPVFAEALRAHGPMLALLAEALHPNLVQTVEGVPALVHGGPFANIAHGCNSVIATRLALQLSDWAVTEAGFGFDLGAEKFFDIKCAGAGLDTAAVVLVATLRALKLHGGVPKSGLAAPDPDAVRKGLTNLAKHVENIRAFGEAPVVALNRFATDTDLEIAVVREGCAALGVPMAVSDHHARGGEGAVDLARAVIDHAERRSQPFRPLYQWKDPIPDKVRAVACTMYGAREVHFTREAATDLSILREHGLEELPVCLAKIPGSLSDDPRLLGRPEGFDLVVRRLLPNTGAGFVVVLTGDILRMPGLPKTPRAESVDWVGGEIIGLR